MGAPDAKALIAVIKRYLFLERQRLQKSIVIAIYKNVLIRHG